MRDPLRPIPAPSSSTFWQGQAAPPPSSRAGAAFDPMSLLRGRESDALGLDRRAHRRAANSPSDEARDRGQALVRAAHTQIQGVMGLCSPGGWALVRAISLAPQGILLRHLDATERKLEPELRAMINTALRSLSPVLGAPRGPASQATSSPLANLGTHLLGRKVVSDAAAWSLDDAEALEVDLVLPGLGVSHGVAGGQARSLARVSGRLSALNDPDPKMLAVALDRRSVAELSRRLCGPRA